MNRYNPAGSAPIVSGAIARIEQRLPQAGEILTRVGARVETGDLIGRTQIGGAPVILHIARTLDLPVAQAIKALRRSVGETIQQGEELARGRLPGQRVLAPISGTLAAIDAHSGYVALVPTKEAVELRAGTRGVIMEIYPNEGVRIETPAAQIYGVFGLGSERNGVLSLLTTAADEPITPALISAKHTYAVVIGGAGISAAALRRAVAERVAAVIVGSIDEAELRAFLEAPGAALWDAGEYGWRAGGGLPDPGLTLIVTEGFGNAPMAQPVFDLLAEHDRKEAFVIGSTTLRGQQQRPRVVVPLSARSGAASNLQVDAPQPTLQAGVLVRVLTEPYLGQVGRVRSHQSSQLLASGIRTTAVNVQLEHGTVTLPSAALETLS